MSGINGFNTQEFNKLIEKFKKSFQLNQYIYLIGIAVVASLIFSILLFNKSNDFVAIDLKDDNFSQFENLNQFTNWLQSNNYVYELNNQDNLIYVKSKDYVKIFQKINSNELANNKPVVGFELLDKARTFGSSQFMESIRYRRALEGELARTITAMANIKSARVHLAIPKKSAFIRDVTPSSASVFIKTENMDNFDSDIVDSIVNLIATSITGMKTENVTVVDQSGNLLSSNLGSKNNLSIPLKQEKIKNKYQKKIAL